MKVAELMQTDLKTISVDATVADAVTALAIARVSALPVLDRLGRAVGVLSTRDILLAESRWRTPEERERHFEQTRVLEVMTPWPATVSPEADTREAAREMLYLDVQRLFVEDHGLLVGVLSQTDIVDAVAGARI
jgi:CBS domain-containing membrane protein